MPGLRHAARTVARGGSLPRPTRADEDIRMGDAVLINGIAQRFGDVLLAEHIFKFLRAIFTGED